MRLGEDGENVLKYLFVAVHVIASGEGAVGNDVEEDVDHIIGWSAAIRKAVRPHSTLAAAVRSGHIQAKEIAMGDGD